MNVSQYYFCLILYHCTISTLLDTNGVQQLGCYANHCYSLKSIQAIKMLLKSNSTVCTCTLFFLDTKLVRQNDNVSVDKKNFKFASQGTKLISI